MAAYSRVFWCLALASFLLPPQHAQATPEKVPESDGIRLPFVYSSDAGIDVKDHLVIGPFPIARGENINRVDYLKRINLGEDIPSAAEFSERLKAIGVRAGENIVHPKWLVMNEHRHFVDFNHTFGQPESKETGGALAYVAFNIKCREKSSPLLLLGCSGAPRIIVNGEPTHSFRGKWPFFVYEKAFELPLETGDNLILIKIPRQEVLWGLCAHLSFSNSEIAPVVLSAQSTLEKFILKRSIYRSFDDPVEISPRGLPGHIKVSGEIRSVAGTRSGTIKNNVAQWDNTRTGEAGLHKVVVTIKGREYYERLLVGEPAHAIQDMILEIDALPFHMQEKGGFPAIRARLERTTGELDKMQRASEKIQPGQRWSRRTIYELWTAWEALLRIRRGEAPFSHVRGLHLNGFKSRIDNSQQCYRIYVPSFYQKDGEPLPLVIMLPTAVSAAKPFWESPFLDDFHTADRLAKLAEKHGIILLWAGYHNRPTGLPMESAHLAEVLEAVGRDYLFDHKRVSLMGTCSAAPLALDASASWPRRFSGIAILNPEFVLDQNMPRHLVAIFSKRKEFREWFMNNNRPNTYFRSKNPDIYMINDGGDEMGHGDLKTSKAFADKAERAGAPVRFEMPPRRESAHLGGWEDLIEWAAQQRSETGWEDGAPRVRRESVQDALTEKFWVVRGTIGSAEETAVGAAVADAVLEGWRKTHFAPCRLVMDSELTANEMRGSNLVLIGNARTNSVWRELDKGLGVTITGDGVTLGERSWFGDDAAIQAVVRHPKNSARRVVVIGGVNLSPESFGTLNLSRDGWFRYAVWGGGGDGAELRDAGN
jgi:hypothetical protein